MVYRFLLVGLVLFSGLIAPPSFAAEPSLEEEVSRQLREATAGDSAGVAVLVARDGKIVFQGGFGLADVENKQPITPETKFRIGSVTKQFTAAAMLRLAEQGKLKLDDTVAEFLPDFPSGDCIPLHQLLTHTSGLHSFTEKPDFLSRVKEAIEPAKVIEWFRDDPPDFSPGKGFRYNNSAYFLAGEIVAKASGKPFGEYLRETFFEPLKMNDTGIYVNSDPPPGMAHGYSLQEDKFEPAVDWNMSWAGGAGALYSTVGDLYRWNEALFGGRVLNEASFQAATTPVSLPDDVEGMKYGYGLMLFEVKRLPAIRHGGGLHGWSSDLLRLPEQRCTVVVLSNALPGRSQLNPAAISRALAERLLVEEIAKLPAPEEDKSIDPKTFADYTGRFDYKSAILTVTVEGEELHAQLTDQPKHRIFPKAKDAFFWKVVDAEVAFERDEKGQVVAARHTQGGVTFKAPKLEEKVKLTAEQVEAFVGKYQYGPGAVMTVTRDGVQLFGQLTGQPKLPIFPTSETEFEWRVVKAKVEFVKDKEGKVTKAVHHQNGGTIEAPRVE